MLRFACMYVYIRAARNYSYRLDCTPTSFKGRNHGQIQRDCKILMMLLDQSFALFRIVHLVFLEVETDILKMEVAVKCSE
jgi:hypothetical protein